MLVNHARWNNHTQVQHLANNKRELETVRKRRCRFLKFSKRDIDHDEDILPDQDILEISFHTIVF